MCNLIDDPCFTAYGSRRITGGAQRVHYVRRRLDALPAPWYLPSSRHGLKLKGGPQTPQVLRPQVPAYGHVDGRRTV